LETNLTKEALQNELLYGQQPAIELLYNTYGRMLYGYVLQFVPDEPEAEELLITIFIKLAPRLQEACDSNLRIFSWLQIEARKIILDIHTPSAVPLRNKATYSSLLEDASPEHQEVFNKSFLSGIPSEELAFQQGKDLHYINRLLKECLLIIRKKLG